LELAEAGFWNKMDEEGPPKKIPRLEISASSALTPEEGKPIQPSSDIPQGLEEPNMKQALIDLDHKDRNNPEVAVTQAEEITTDGVTISAKANHEHQATDLSISENNQDHALTPTAPISKRQMKKALRRQKWDENRDAFLIKRREKAAAKKQRKRDAKEQARLQREQEGGNQNNEDEKRLEDEKAAFVLYQQVPATLILDCAFDELMAEKEIISLTAQITRCYSAIRQSPFQPQLLLTNYSGNMKTRFETKLRRNYLSWKRVRFFEEDFLDQKVREEERRYNNLIYAAAAKAGK
jgi:tRNA (guanine9-N1)-methyltransferase